MPVSIRLEADIERRLEGLAKATGRAKTTPLDDLLRRYDEKLSG